MKLKLDANGNAVLKDGKPVYVNEAGQEIVIDGADLFTKVNTLTEQNQTLQTAATSLKQYEGLDAAKARAALDFVANYDANKEKSNEDIEALRIKFAKEAEEKYAPTVAELNKLKSDYASEKIGNSFNESKFIKEKLTIPADMVRAMFGASFKHEDGKVFAYDAAGNKMLSKSRAGEYATVDEALESFVSSYSSKDAIMKGSQADGGGFNGSQGGQGGQGGKTMGRSEFDGLNPQSQSEFFASGGTLTD